VYSWVSLFENKPLPWITIRKGFAREKMFLLISSENAVFDVIQAEDVTAYVVTNYPFYSLVVGQHLCQSPRGLLPEIHSEDGKALCLYLPISSKDLSYRIYSNLRQKIAQFTGDEQYYITGLPVAEDTFGVEMFKQMAISAPIAMIIIFLIMLFFFGSPVLSRTHDGARRLLPHLTCRHSAS